MGVPDSLLGTGESQYSDCRGEKTIGHQQGSAIITAKKGFCYLTIKSGRHNYHIMRIRAYTLDAEDKRKISATPIPCVMESPRAKV